VSGDAALSTGLPNSDYPDGLPASSGAFELSGGFELSGAFELSSGFEFNSAGDLLDGLEDGVASESLKGEGGTVEGFGGMDWSGYGGSSW